ncbi:MAG: hypothetical protein CMM50_18780 [Rhodospirillaceae bacterium]|nr:hypothetical protein [Rhodospirillaceae bacterium]
MTVTMTVKNVALAGFSFAALGAIAGLVAGSALGSIEAGLSASVVGASLSSLVGWYLAEQRNGGSIELDD